jgi:4a-hydroxytetrahydrobiopterin dehydratase
MWTEKDNALQRTFKFRDFIEAWAFMTEVAFHAEKLKHHPNWSNSYNSVEFMLNTHDKGGIVTKKDHDLAEAIDEVYQKFKPISV